MQNTKEILNWNINPTDLKKRGSKVITNDTKTSLDISIQHLKNISERLPVGSQLPPKKLIKDTYWQFHTNINKDYSYLLSLHTKKDARILIWALTYRENKDMQPILFTDEFEIAIKIILDKWRDSFIISLWHVLIKNWLTLLDFKEQRSILVKVLNSKSSQYNKTRNDIINITTNINLFNKINSPLDYAKNLLNKNILIHEAYQLINQKESLLVENEFFSLVIEQYVRQLDKIAIGKTKKEMLLSVYQFLFKHNSQRTTLIVCSLVLNSIKFNKHIDIVKRQTLKMIGDPVKIHLWSFSGLNSRQELTIEIARKKLNTLLNEKFIRIFFEKLVSDDRRKRFWLEFIDKIENIKFSGNRQNYYYLKSIESVSEHVDSRYKITARNQDTCAIIIYSKNYVFVEFTNVGALYVYKQQNFNVNLNSISSMADLKTLSRSTLACGVRSRESYYYSTSYYTNPEGRITHQGDWESRVNAWMKKYYD